MTAEPARLTLAAFWHHLPREGKLLLSVVAVEFIGTGLVLPFYVVYLHEVRGFTLSHVGLLLGLSPLAGFVVVGPVGVAIDRYGARRVMAATLVMLMTGDAVLAFADTGWRAALALAMIGASFAASWPTSQSMIATVVPTSLRQRYFGVNFSLLNLGIGIGGLLGGQFVDVDRLITFQAIYLLDGVSYLPALLLLLGPLRHIAGRPPAHDTGPRVGYREVVSAPAMPGVLFLTFVSAFVGYGQLNSGMPAFARAVGKVSTEGLGYAFAANTLVIVSVQLLVLRHIEGHRRTRVIVVMGVVWALSWLCLGLSGLLPGELGATVLVAAMAAVFGFGETLLQPTIPALLNDLAPDALRGRYNAANSAVFQIASFAAPPVAGRLIDLGLTTTYIGLLVIGSLCLGVIAVRLEPRLPAGVNGRPAMAVGPRE